MGGNSDPEREYDECFKRLFLKGEIRKCGSISCIGNSYLIRGEEFVSPNGRVYCSKGCYEYRMRQLEE